MGYDYRWVTKPEGVNEKLDQARARYHEALQARDALPKEEQGRWSPQGPEEFAGGTQRWRDAANAVMRASDEVDRANVSDFRLNIWGGGRYVGAMETLGMARSCREPSSTDWPKLEEPESMPESVNIWDVSGMVDDHVSPDADSISIEPPADLPSYYQDEWKWLAEHPGFLARLREYNARKTELLTSAPDSGSMWTHKIAGSNDGWINTPEEIRSALKIYEELDPFEITETLKAHGIGDLDYWARWIEFLRNAAEQGGGFRTY